MVETHFALLKRTAKKDRVEIFKVTSGKVKTKIEQAQKLHDAGMKAHSDGDHSKSEQLLNEALDLFKS